MEKSEPLPCPFRARALRFVERHPAGSDVTPIDFRDLDSQGIRSKKVTPEGAVYSVNCSLYFHCMGTLAVELDGNTLAQTAWTGACSENLAAARPKDGPVAL